MGCPKEKLSKTDRVLVGMLTENTGRHMLDSGGAYGRNWEQNQGRDFMAEVPVTLSFSNGELSVTKNVFHFLRDCLTYNPMLNDSFRRYAGRKSNEDKYWPELMEEFAKRRARLSGHYDSAYTINTYNGEDLLSQVLQYTAWVDDDGEHVLLQVHGGCDVRGGYTSPKAFDTNWDYSLRDNADATVHCPVCRASWYTDDAYHWYEGNSPDPEALDPDPNTPRLFDVEALAPIPMKSLALTYSQAERKEYDKAYPWEECEEFPTERTAGTLYVNAEGQALCPHCSSGILTAY